MTAENKIIGKILITFGLAQLEADQFPLVLKQDVPFRSEKIISPLPEKPRIFESKLQNKNIRNSLPR